MIPHLKHYTHAPNYKATHAIASRGFALQQFRVGPHERRQKKRIIRRSRTSQRQTSGYISVVSLEVVTP